MCAAAKAMIKLLGWTYRKTGRFFVMEWTQTHEVCATLFELDILTHHIDNIDASK